jgi:hypothetical protein
MISFTTRFVPDSIAVKIAEEQGLFIAQQMIVMMERFPYLRYITTIAVVGIPGPDGI